MSHSDGSESVSSADQDADGTSTADYPSLSDLIDLVQKGRVAPSVLFWVPLSVFVCVCSPTAVYSSVNYIDRVITCLVHNIVVFPGKNYVAYRLIAIPDQTGVQEVCVQTATRMRKYPATSRWALTCSALFLTFKPVFRLSATPLRLSLPYV